jgi:cellobiose-specific phosphotransferase system component IIA
MRVYRDDQKFLQFRINAVLWGIVAVSSSRRLVLVRAGRAGGEVPRIVEANALRDRDPPKRGLIMTATARSSPTTSPRNTLQIDRVVKPLAKADTALREAHHVFAEIFQRPPAEAVGHSEGSSVHAALHAQDDLSMSQVAAIQARRLRSPRSTSCQCSAATIRTARWRRTSSASSVKSAKNQQNPELEQGDLIG